MENPSEIFCWTFSDQSSEKWSGIPTQETFWATLEEVMNRPKKPIRHLSKQSPVQCRDSNFNYRRDLVKKVIEFYGTTLVPGKLGGHVFCIKVPPGWTGPFFG